MNELTFEIRSQNEEERIVSGIAVPYGQEISVGGVKERFERGAISNTNDVKLLVSPRTNRQSPTGRRHR